MDISKSPVVGMNVNLDAAVKKLEDAISEIAERCVIGTAEAIAAIDINPYDEPVIHANKIRQIQAECGPGSVPGYNYLLGHRRMFSGTEVEICCPDTGFHVWAETQEKAVALWERIISQRELNDCCKDKDNDNHKTVYAGGGFPMIHCRDCGRRFVPLP